MKLVPTIFYSCAFVFLLSCPQLTLAWRSFKIIFTQFKYQTNSNFVDAKIQIQNASESSIDGAFSINEILDDFYLTTVIALEALDGNYTVFLNRSLNFCDFLKHRNGEPVFRDIYEDLSRRGNFFKECPVKKGSYAIHEYSIDEEMLPSYLPETNFRISLEVKTSKGVMIFNGEICGFIDKSKGFNNLKMFSLG